MDRLCHTSGRLYSQNLTLLHKVKLLLLLLLSDCYFINFIQRYNVNGSRCYQRYNGQCYNGQRYNGHQRCVGVPELLC